MESSLNLKFSAVTTDLKEARFSTEEIKRQIGDNEVLVKVISAPVNPSDTYCAKGVYGNLGKFSRFIYSNII